ncbi:Glutamyl-tRNA(Gln) amidotransferase subunit A [Pandoraea iniqua]|uniref:amidase family protein n=1 Tax=Pandoraea iniqua TaxID=2508288 RepID=UPI00123F7783|nr:amidase family protein [Pandoraea iniqua]VVE18089.1 Glutamyl-tRNA(Gln) amidotransferase subunit A [Pandoraea iniqua]
MSGTNTRARFSALVDSALDAATRHGAAFTQIYREATIAQAAAMDARCASGGTEWPPTLAGLPVTIKDNMDVAGEPTAAGSPAVMATASPAATDAVAVGRLRAAGAIIVGKTAMSELALSSVGLIEGTQRLPNPLDPDRVPGGSSCGAAVSVAVGAACAALGTDTGGSVQLPAALCGLVGFKPTASQISREGVLPLSQYLDSVGVMAKSVRRCRMVYEAVAQNASMCPPNAQPRPVKGLRFAVPKNYVLADLDPAVAAAFDKTLSVLSAHGAILQDIELPALDRIPDVYEGGGFSMAEIYAWLRSRGSLRRSLISPRAFSRIEQGGVLSAADMIDRLSLRGALVDSADRGTRDWDALLMPTCPILPPLISAVANDEGYRRYNMLLMRNSRVANVLDRCAITLPADRRDRLPVGVTLMGPRGYDEALLTIAEAVEGMLPGRGM